MSALEDLVMAVKASVDAATSAKVLIAGIADRIEESTDTEALKVLASALRESTADLSNAVVTYEKPDGVHYVADSSTSPLYRPNTSKAYDATVNLVGGANRLAIAMKKDPDWAADKPELAEFRKDWSQYFNKEWHEKWYGKEA